MSMTCCQLTSGQVNKDICIACLKVMRNDYQEKTNLLVYSFLVRTALPLA